jgi:hypothetical protein
MTVNWRSKIRIALAVGGGVVLAGCGPNKVDGPFQLGPVTHVRAFDVVTGSQSVSATKGSTVHLALREYDGRDSVPSVRGQWLTRNAGIASNSGSAFTAVNAGQTYAVGEVTDNGRIFSDSVLVTAVPQ